MDSVVNRDAAIRIRQERPAMPDTKISPSIRGTKFSIAYSILGFISQFQINEPDPFSLLFSHSATSK